MAFNEKSDRIIELLKDINDKIFYGFEYDIKIFENPSVFSYQLSQNKIDDIIIKIIVFLSSGN